MEADFPVPRLGLGFAAAPFGVDRWMEGTGTPRRLSPGVQPAFGIDEREMSPPCTW